MPIYEYECNQCGEPFERMVRFSEVDQMPGCPKCESRDTHKKISMAASIVSSGLGSASSSSNNCGLQGGFT